MLHRTNLHDELNPLILGSSVSAVMRGRNSGGALDAALVLRTRASSPPLAPHPLSRLHPS